MPSPAEWIQAFLEARQAETASAEGAPIVGRPLPQPFPFPIPFPEPGPDFEVDLIRPDDLLSLHIAGFNLRVVEDKTHPHLARIDDTVNTLLVVTFPPQSINESATFEGDTPAAPGQPAKNATIVARFSGQTRLVFRVAANEPFPAIPYSIEGLLDWSGFELAVAPLADIPPTPDPGQIAGAPGITQPDSSETAIELPERLLLSPDHSAVWRHSIKPVTHASWTELWHTRLALKEGTHIVEPSQKNPAPLRVLWSPDYIPDNPPLPSALDPELGLTAISPNDRYQIVILNSAFHGYLNEDGTPFVPTPVNAELLMLSTLGGWLRSRGSWNPPHTEGVGFIPIEQGWEGWLGRIPLTDLLSANLTREALDPAARVIALPAAQSQLDVSEWMHIAAQGRDNYVRVVYEGHLFPFGHRAAIIKVTERRFIDTGAGPVAYLIQFEYIVVREREKIYTQQPYQHEGREMPFQSVRLTTLVTPHIVNRFDPSVAVNGTLASCWIVENATREDVKFHAIATDIAGNQTEFTTSLIFADLQDLVDSPPPSIPPDQVAGQYQNHYNEIFQEYMRTGNDTRRVCAVPGHKVTYAPRDISNKSKDNTTLTTSGLYFNTDAAPGLPAFGGFLPNLYKAEVNVPAIEQLLGTNNATVIRLFGSYLDNNLDPNAGVFAEIIKDTGAADPETRLQPDSLPIIFTADKAGGITTPNLALSCLTRAHGPLAGSPQNAAQDLFDANDFFGSSAVTLPTMFGSLKLTDILPANDPTATASVNAPKVQFKTVKNPDGSRKIVTTFDWSPQIHAFNGDNLQFTPDDSSGLSVKGRIEKPVGAGNQPGTSKFTGKLGQFHLDFFDVIRVNVVSMTFNSINGSKPLVKVNMDKGTPVEFEGDLTFVNDLRKIIPSGAFGVKLSIDLTPEPGLHVGFGIGLPPISVGIFELTHIRLSTGLDLPFINGKPRFDFGFCERFHPFLLRVYIFGGGGFFHLQLDTDGIRMLEAGFEFGAVADLDFGVASGGIHIFAGIYFSMQVKTIKGKDQNVSALTGYLRMGGELSVLGIISVSIELVLSFTYVFETGKATGRATLTISVSILFFSISVSLTVEKSFGGSGGDPSFLQMIDTPAVWKEYAGAFA